jgi:hypothetical protein
MVERLPGLKKIKNIDDQTQFRYFLVFLSLLLGIFVRYYFISGTQYPVNDGGLFYRMTEDLLTNNLILPKYTSYNLADIPFAYPPLSFYLTALIHLLTKISLIKLFRFLPLIFTILTIPAFYSLARRVMDNKTLAALSVFFFSMIPRSYEWFVMGGGITRALAFLSAIIALSSIWDMFTKKLTWWIFIKVVLFSSFTVLSHPETALFVVFGAAMLFLYHRPQWINLRNSIFVALAVILCSTPWLISVYHFHGMEPFLGAGGTGHGSWLEIKNLITLEFGFENTFFLRIISLFAVIAFFVRRDKLTYSLSGLILSGYILFPRSGPNLLTIVVSPLAAMGFSDLLFLLAGDKRNGKDILPILERSKKSQIFLLFLMVYLFLGSTTYKFSLDKDLLRLNDEVVQTFQWIEDHTSMDDGIMIYPPRGEVRFWWNDYVAEWFPALTNRSNLSTVQGYEWIPGEFENKVWNYILLYTCAEVSYECIDLWEEYNDAEVDYLVINETENYPDFINGLVLSGRYRAVYQQESIVVLEKNTLR